MALWCRNFPTVSVDQAATPKRVTFVLPYYLNADFLRHQLSVWKAYPADLQSLLSVIVVDDGSPVPAAIEWPMSFDLRLFRIHEDRRWNWLAARNIGAHQASDGWLLLTDMDHVVPERTLRGIVEGAHNPDVVYAFARREHTGEVVAPHSASFLMTRSMFWAIGGYDEALAGYYGTDGAYRREVIKRAKIHLLADELVRHEYVGDSSTSAYQRKQPEDAAVKGLIAQRRPGWKPRTLSFPYHEIALQGVPCLAR